MLSEAQGFFRDPKSDAVIREVSAKPLSGHEIEPPFANGDSKQDDRKS